MHVPSHRDAVIFFATESSLVMNHRPNLHCRALTSLDCNFYYSNLRLHIGRTNPMRRSGHLRAGSAAFAQKNIQNEAKFTNAFNEPRSTIGPSAEGAYAVTRPNERGFNKA